MRTTTTPTATDALVAPPKDTDWNAIRRPILMLATMLLVMVVGMCWLFWQQAASVVDAGQNLSRTRQMVSILDNTLSTLRVADGDVQGYVVTADPTYSKLYFRSRELLSKQLYDLQQIASSRNLQLKNLSDLMRSKVLDMDRTIGARTPKNFRDSWLIVVRGSGKQLMDDITLLMGTIKNSEEERATRSAMTVASSNRNILTFLPIVLIIYGAMVALLVVFCFKFMHEKTLGKLQIAQLNEDLRARVRDLETMTAEIELARDFAMEANKLKSQFIANMSHEIRTPMSGVLGMSELLMDNEEIDADSHELIGYIHSSATNLLTVVNDLLDFAKLEAGKVVLETNIFSIQDLVKDTVASVTPDASKKELEISQAVSKELPANLVGDSGRLRQVLLNLMHNAVKFTPSGTVEVSAHPAVQSRDNVLVLFEVRDTGIGITDDVQRRLFEPFVQADSSTTRRYGGTGLGLSICRSLVELMSGRIGVRSESGAGSTFWFTIPLRISALKRSPHLTDEAA